MFMLLKTRFKIYGYNGAYDIRFSRISMIFFDTNLTVGVVLIDLFSFYIHKICEGHIELFNTENIVRY